MDDKLQLRYIPLNQARRWDENPKLHDFDALIKSIEKHGFGDPPKFDATLEAFVYGNGRTEALERMRTAGRPRPRGIGETDDGEWAVPVIFGVDAKSRDAAVAFAIDHNNLTLQGGGLSFADVLQIWDEPSLLSVFENAPGAGMMLASWSEQELAGLLAPDFAPVPAEEQSRLDEKAAEKVCCPECGHEFEV